MTTVLVGEPPHLPTLARALAGRAQVYAAEGRAVDAVADCYDALRLAPLYAYPRFTLAGLYRELAQYELCEQHLCRLIELLQAGAERDRARRELAATYRRQAESKEGAERLRLLDTALNELVTITREPWPHRAFDAEVQEEMAEILHLMGRTNDAIVALRAGICTVGRQSGDARRHGRLAELLAEREAPEAVVDELEAARTACAHELTQSANTDAEEVLREQSLMLAIRLVLFLADQGIKLHEAQLLAEGTLSSAKQTARLSLSRLAECEDACGWVAYREGKFGEAIHHFEAALDQSGGDALEWAHLALGLEAKSAVDGTRNARRTRVEDLNRARDVWQQILEKFPDSTWAARAEEHLGRIPGRPHAPMPLITNH